MLIDYILNNCNDRYVGHDFSTTCTDCTCGTFCEHSCEKCLHYIHSPHKAPPNYPDRKYDCSNMADMYTCKYSYRYTSEMIYALKRLNDARSKKELKVLSFGCGPCTDLMALDYLREKRIYSYEKLSYRGVDYSRDVWKLVHQDIKDYNNEHVTAKFFYEDACILMDKISSGTWIPDIITFQYVLSDMQKHTGKNATNAFIGRLATFINDHMASGSYVVLNDANFGIDYGGGREYFDRLFNRIHYADMRKGRFHNDNRSFTYPYGEDSDGEFLYNKNIFKWNKEWENRYTPFDTCASAQMIIKRIDGI